MPLSLDIERPETWVALAKISYHVRKEWLQKNLSALIKTLHNVPLDKNYWSSIGFILINDNLYKEAEVLYEAMLKRGRETRGNLAVPAYYRGIARFLQGRFKEAYEDFKTSRQYDLHHKKFDSRSARAIAYMEETLFPTKEIIKKNQDKLAKDLNSPRMINKIMGPHILRTIHKWNSATPLFSHGISQGGGYFFTLHNHKGEVKGIAIDPGYDFFTIFKDLGLGIADIDAIIITHDHDDHTESVEGILSLLARYNDHNLEKKSKVIDIFGSAGVLLKFHGLLSATDLFGNKEINFKLLVPGSHIAEIEGQSLKEKCGFTLQVKPAYHSERWTNQESAVGLVIETNLKDKEGNVLKIGITGDSRYEVGLGREYKDAQILLINIGSIEKEEGKLLNQHLGMCGCINLIKEARLGKPLLAILTEFGEEFSGRREIISKIIENWAQPMDGKRVNQDLRIIPADVHLELRLNDLNIRETDTNIFFPYQMIEVDEENPEILKYRFKG